MCTDVGITYKGKTHYGLRKKNECDKGDRY